MNRLVIGVGFREQATAQSIAEVLAAVAARPTLPGVAAVIAVVEDKAAHPSLLAAARATQLAIETVPADAMRRAGPGVATRSERIEKQRGVGSVCEATALAAAGAGARLVVTRIVSADRYATAAAAIPKETIP